MQVYYRKSFLKQYKKVPLKIQRKFKERLELLLTDQEHPLLHVHQLTGELSVLSSMNVTGDYHALFTLDVAPRSVIFFYIGTHSELYGK